VPLAIRAITIVNTNAENQVSDKTHSINVLLISANPANAALLIEAMEREGLAGEIHRARPSPAAVESARRCGRFRYAPPHDFVLLDFSDPDEASLAVVSELAFGASRARVPIVLLTSTESEFLLKPDSPLTAGTSMFAPTTLGSFIGKMRQHSRKRFLRALAVMSELGPVIVRLPLALAANTDETREGAQTGYADCQVA
jgi:CheY-like chemotaxis protein